MKLRTTVKRCPSWIIQAGCIAITAVLAQRASAQTAWSAAVDGEWSDGTKWTAGVPTNNAASLIATSADYTVSVDSAPAHPVKDLTVRQSTGGNTTTLDVEASGFIVNDGTVMIGRNATLNVNAAGIMGYTETEAYPSTGTFTRNIVTVQDGGVLKVDGGTVDYGGFFIAQTSGNQNRRIQIGINAAGGTLSIAGGDFVFAGPAGDNTKRVDLRIADGTDARGVLTMTGGALTVHQEPGGGSTSFNLAPGVRSYGEINLSGTAALTITNWVSLATGGPSTGLVTLAGNSSMSIIKGRARLGSGIGATGILTVQDQASLSWNTESLSLGGYDSNSRGGTGVVNIAAGTVRMLGATSSLRAGVGVGGYTGYGEVNMSGGAFIKEEVGNGMTYGNGLASGDLGHGILNMSGGVLFYSGGWNQHNHPINGIVAGQTVPASDGHLALGSLNISGDAVITNRGQFAAGAYVGATGTVVQTGGRIRQETRPTTLGWFGGMGSYTMSDGVFETTAPVFIGGLTTSDLGYVPSVAGFDPNATGTGVLTLEGGTFTANNTLYLSRQGTGTLRIRGGGTLTTQNLSLESGTAKLRFEFGAAGIGTLTVSDTMTIHPDAKLEVDASQLTENGPFVLVHCNVRTTAFDPGNIVITGAPGGFVDQDSAAPDILFKHLTGTLISIR